MAYDRETPRPRPALDIANISDLPEPPRIMFNLWLWGRTRDRVRTWKGFDEQMKKGTWGMYFEYTVRLTPDNRENIHVEMRVPGTKDVFACYDMKHVRRGIRAGVKVIIEERRGWKPLPEVHDWH